MGIVNISLLTFSCLLITSFAQAAIPVEKYSIEKILAQKDEKKFTQLKKLGSRVYSDLKLIAFNEDRNIAIRWQAFMAMARLGERDSLPEVEQAMKSKDWFLRNAALKILPLIDEDKAYNYSIKGLSDSALVVRTQAVDTLGKINKSDCAPELWKQLYNKENFHKKQSLWIRRHIVEVLAQLSPSGSEEKFIKVLDDTDSALFSPAIKGLERLTGQNLGGVTMPPVYKRYLWRDWWKKSSDSKSKKS